MCYFWVIVIIYILLPLSLLAFTEFYVILSSVSKSSTCRFPPRLCYIFLCNSMLSEFTNFSQGFDENPCVLYTHRKKYFGIISENCVIAMHSLTSLFCFAQLIALTANLHHYKPLHLSNCCELLWIKQLLCYQLLAPGLTPVLVLWAKSEDFKYCNVGWPLSLITLSCRPRNHTWLNFRFSLQQNLVWASTQVHIIYFLLALC